MTTPATVRTVLLVDDDHDVHMFVKTVFRRLKRADLHLEFAPDGHAAVQALDRHGDRLGLILTDLNMPRMDGHGLISAARAAGYAGPIILIGGVPEAGHAADEWVPKDDLLAALPALVERYLP
jgi:two-component system C4-dicarboxylate transport response regulator DctD